MDSLLQKDDESEDLKPILELLNNQFEPLPISVHILQFSWEESIQLDPYDKNLVNHLCDILPPNLDLPGLDLSIQRSEDYRDYWSRTNSGRMIGSIDLIDIEKLLKKNTFGWFAFEYYGIASELKEILSITTSTKIEIEYAGENDVAIQEIFPLLRKSSSVGAIKLNCNLSDSGMCAFALALEENDSIEAIEICSEGVFDVGVQALASALTRNTRVQKLELFTEMSDVGAQALANAFRQNTGVKELDIYTRSHTLTDLAAHAFAATLLENNTLERIFFGGHGRSAISDLGALALLEAVKTNGTILYIHLNNEVSVDIRDKIREATENLLGEIEFIWW